MKAREFWVIFERELRAVVQERTILIALAIQLFIASFSSALLIGLISVYDPDALGLGARLRVRVGVLGNANSPLVEFLKEYNARVTIFATPEETENAFQAGKIDAAVFIPDVELGNDGAIVNNVKLFLPEFETRETLVMMALRKPLKQYENYLREKNDIQVRYKDIGGEPATTYEFQYAVLLPLLMFFPAFVTGGMVVDSITEELVNHTLETLWSAPLSLSTILGAKITAALVLAGGQCLLWALLLFFNGIVMQNPGLVLSLAIANAAIIAVGAAFIAVYFKDRERSQFIYSLFIVLSASLSYFFNASPIVLMARLATGDYYAGIVDVGVYGVLLLVLSAAFFSTTEKLITVPS